jgi:hypothetical protein
MRQFKMLKPVLALAAALAIGSVAACSHPYEYNDVAHGDHHRWDSREDAAYRRWEAERRIDHIEFDRRTAADQSAYWTWRHAHP